MAGEDIASPEEAVAFDADKGNWHVSAGITGYPGGPEQTASEESGATDGPCPQTHHSVTFHFFEIASTQPSNWLATAGMSCAKPPEGGTGSLSYSFEPDGRSGSLPHVCGVRHSGGGHRRVREGHAGRRHSQ